MTGYDGFVSGGKPGYHRYSASTLTAVSRVDALDLTAAVGRRQATFRFDLIDGVSGLRKGEIYPLRDQPASITHDTSRTIKRDLKIAIDAADLAEVNALTDRIEPFMLIGGQVWPLGRFMFTGHTELKRTGGDDGAMALMDEMNLVDQEITDSFSSSKSVDGALRDLVSGLNLPKGVNFAATPYPASGGWRTGSRRGQIATTLCVLGDCETPWMDNDGVMRTVRTVDPAGLVPDLSFDDGYPVYRDSISETDDLLDAPNRFVVVGNGSASSEVEIVGIYDLPPSAPHSILNRGFVIQRTTDLQVATQDQANAAARNLGLRSTPVEQVDLTTPPDPRHDSYQVIRWAGSNWLEVAWSMTCVEGGDMTHTLRKAYQA